MVDRFECTSELGLLAVFGGVPRCSAANEFGFGDIDVRFLTPFPRQPVAVEDTAKVVVFVLENPRQPAAGHNIDRIAFEVTPAQSCALGPSEGVSQTGNRQAALFGGFTANATSPRSSKCQSRVQDMALMGTAIRFVVPDKNLESHPHLRGGEAHAGGGMHSVGHIKNEAPDGVGHDVDGGGVLVKRL